MYVKHSSSKISATTNERKTYYVCHRTGTFQSGSCGKRKLKRQGSNKINASCPSTMEVVESLNDGSVKLVLWKTHVGHNAEVSRTFLSATERNWLAGISPTILISVQSNHTYDIPFLARISEGASYQKIMNEIQNLGNKGGRMRFIKSQDIRNMRKNLINSRNRNILSDIRYWVKNVQSLDNTDVHPIIYFKDRNVPDVQKVLSNKDTMLVIMTKFQQEILQKFAHGMICLDATHCQESYEYQLITLYVADNSASWCPAIYCITSIVTYVTIQYFLTKIREIIGEIKCSTFISDNSPPFYDAWCDVMTPPKHHAVHLWYIEKNWKENILKLKCSDNVKSMIYKTLKIMLTESNEKSFEKMLTSFLESLQYDSRLAEFSTYFQTEYVNKTTTWAGCYRKSYGLTFESESLLESMHKRLNKEYHEGVNNQKVKEYLTTLVSISHNCNVISKRITEYCKTKDEFHLQCIQRSHKRGVCIKRSEVIEVSSTTYRVLYSDRPKSDYTVKYSNIKCSCSSICDICKICCHEYTCTCVDYAINYNICEHIHACAIIKNKINVDLSAETDAPLDSFVEEVICEEEIICNVDNLEEACFDDLKVEIADEDFSEYVDISENIDTDDCDPANETKYVYRLIVFPASFDRNIFFFRRNEPVNQFESASETSENICLDDTASALYYEPFTFVHSDEMSDYNQTELQLTQESLQIVAFKEDEYEAVLVNDDDTSSFGDSSSVYEDPVPEKTAIIALNFTGEGSDSYIFRRFDDNTIIRHKVDTLFTLADFDNGNDNDIAIQLNSDINTIEGQGFPNCYGTYDPNDEDIVLSL